MEMPKKKIVPFADAYLTATLSDEKYIKGLIENFICCFSNGDEWIDYYNNYDYMQYSIFKGQLISSDIFKITKNDNICSFIRDALDNGYYAILEIDAFYINGYVSYNQNHIGHPLFIIDYDNNKKLFKCRDYFDFRTYSEKNISFYDIDNYYAERFIKKNNYIDYLMLIFKLHDSLDNTYLEKIDYDKLINSLEKFYKGENADMQAKYSNMIYGINVIDYMIDPVKKINLFSLSKQIAFLEHHIYVMQLRLNYLIQCYKYTQNISLSNHINELAKMCEIIKNLWLKYNTSDSSDIYIKIKMKDHLIKIKYEYTDFIKKLINYIETNKLLIFGML